MNEIWTWLKNNKVLVVDFVVILIAAINLAITQSIFP